MDPNKLNNFLKDVEIKKINIERSTPKDNKKDNEVQENDIDLDITKLDNLLESKDILALTKAQTLILEIQVPSNIYSKNVNSTLKKLKKSYLGSIAKRIDELSPKTNNFLYVSNYIHDQNYSFEQILEYECSFYSLLPLPWNKTHPFMVRISKTAISERIENVTALKKHEEYNDWVRNFMTTIGALTIPVVYKIEALCKSLENSFDNLLSHIGVHGYTFYTYYRIIKDLESLCRHPKADAITILNDAYNNDYKLGSKTNFINFACKLSKITNILNENFLVKYESDVLNSCYRVMGKSKSSEFHYYCSTVKSAPRLSTLRRWIDEEIEKLSENEKIPA